MDVNEIKSEIEIRINPIDFSISSMDLHDIMNSYDIDEEGVVFIYNQIMEERREEIVDSTQEVIKYFQNKDEFYPSYNEFKREFERLEDYTVSDKILRPIFKKELYDENQLSLFESIKEELSKVLNESIKDDEELDDATEKIIKRWGGSLEKDKSAKLSPEDIFDIIDAGEIARKDIESEFGDDDFMPLDDDEYKSIMSDLDESDGVEKNMLKVLDAEGNEIKRGALVLRVDNLEKKGRVKGFGDDGQGRLEVLVSWEFPIDMKITNPEEMGDKREYPENLVRANKEKMFEMDKINETKIPETMEKLESLKMALGNKELDELIIFKLEDSLANEILDSIAQGYDINLEEYLDEIRGLGKSVNRMGDRNVKMRDDKSHSPLTKLNESVNSEIKEFLSKESITKKELKNFISEQAKRVSYKMLK